MRNSRIHMLCPILGRPTSNDKNQNIYYDTGQQNVYNRPDSRSI